jgi:hypothetical protein
MKPIVHALAIIALGTLAEAFSDLTAAEPSPSAIKIENVEMKTEALPGSNRPWTKLMCRFSSTQKWTDGISFNWAVLVRSPDSSNPRILTGGQTYANIPQGQSLALMYLSPNATARYGQPIAIKVEAFRGDRLIDEFSWEKSGASASANWEQSSNPFSGVLLSIRSTPWILTDSDKSPDLVSY